MNFTQKSRLRLNAKSSLGQWTPHFLVKTEKANSDITRLDAQDQEIVVVRAGELHYQRNSQGNLVAGTDQPTRKPIYGEVDGQTVITGYEEIPSDDTTVTTNAIYGTAGKDKILGLTGSDLLGGFGGNDEIDGGEGDDYISSSANVIRSQQQWGKDDVWVNYGLPQGKQAISTQALWGTYKDGAGEDAVTVWAGITETDTNTTDSDVIDAGAGDDWVIAGWADDRIKGGKNNTTNSIALCAVSMRARARFGIKNRSCKSKPRFISKRSKPQANTARSAIEFVVIEQRSNAGAYA